MEKPINANTKDVLMYGDRVRFHWADVDYVCNHDLELNWEGDLEGIYAGPWMQNQKLAVVTVVTPGQYQGKVFYPYIKDLKRVNTVSNENTREIPVAKKKYDKITLYKMRDNVLENIDFGRIHQVMECLDWEWWGCGVPDMDTIKEEAKYLLDSVISRHLSDGECMNIISTGGFEVSLNICKDDGIPDLSLKFVVEEWYEGGDCWNEYARDFEKRNSKPVSKKKRKRKSRTLEGDIPVSYIRR